MQLDKKRREIGKRRRKKTKGSKKRVTKMIT
jgi:hypothetical protein